MGVTRTQADDTAPATSVPQPPILPAADANTHDTNISDSDAWTTDHVDWSSAQQTDPVVHKIFHWVNSDSIRPQPISITDRSTKFKTLAAKFERLVIHNGILYRTAYCDCCVVIAAESLGLCRVGRSDDYDDNDDDANSMHDRHTTVVY